nr:MAG: hypothetical protein DIU78_18080 [Pseudomonadota bacterium]
MFQGGPTAPPGRVPKRGFRVPFAVETVPINVGVLDAFPANSVVDEAALRRARLVQGQDVRIKILGDGELTKPLTVHAHGFSRTALEKIEKAGGKAIPLSGEPATTEGS